MDKIKTLINSSFISNTQNQITSLIKLHQSRKQSGLYNFINNIPKFNLFTYFMAAFVLYNIINYIDFSVKNFLVVLVVLFILYFFNDMYSFNNINRMEEIELKLLSIKPKPEYFYLDAGIIELIYSIYDLRDYNTLTFNKIILFLDNFLKLRLYAEEDDILFVNHIQNMKKYKKLILNHMQSLQLSLNSNYPQLVIKLNKAIKEMHVLLNIHIRNVENIANIRNKDVDIWTTFINNTNLIEPNDYNHNKYFDIY
jgi:hypothetical protein